MDIGDFGYLIFLAIVGVANFLRSRKQRQEEREARENAPPPPRETRRGPNVPRPDPLDEPSGEAPDWGRMIGELFGETEEVPERPSPKTERTVQKPAAAEPELRRVAASGYREGESLAEFAARTRREGSRKLAQGHLEEADRSRGPAPGIDFEPEWRRAVIYDAIWNRPYGD